MIDVHNHLLYGVDDGPKNINDSIILINKLKDFGYTDIILTPHYMKNTKYNKNAVDNTTVFENLKTKVDGVNLYLGNEIYIDNDIQKLLDDNEIIGLNKTNYLLIEIPVNNSLLNLDSILFNLISNNYIPILAHVERYSIFKDNYSLIDKYHKMGVLFQGNLLDLVGDFGLNSKRLLKRLLKDKYISFIGTDMHNFMDNKKYNKAIKKLKHICDNNYYNDLTINNAKKIII